MGVVEEIIANKEELLIRFLDALDGRKATTRVDLDGVQFTVGESKVRLKGQVSFIITGGKKK